MKKWILIVLCLMIVSYVGYQYTNKGNSQPAAPTFSTATVQKGRLEVKVSGSGSVQPVSSTDVQATSSKQVYEVLVKTGDEVKAGQNLITFTDGSTSITAPHDGIVTSLTVSPNERVNIGQVVAHITNYKDLQTVIQIDELDIPKIKLAQVVTIKASSFPDEIFTGKVSAISNEGTVSNGVSTFDVTVHIDTPKALKVGMTTEGSILTDSKDQALFVPVEAVHSRNNQKYVLIKAGQKNDQKAQLRFVKTGLYNEDNVEITNGLAEGDIVLLPVISVNNTNNNGNFRGMGMGGMGGIPGMGGSNRMGRSWGSGSGSGQGSGSRSGGRSGS